MGDRARQHRSDKKIGINPTVSRDFYDMLARLGYVCNCSVKDIGETLVVLGLNNKAVIDDISELFRRPYWFDDNIMKNGDPKRPKYRYVVGPEQQRIGLRFYQPHYEKVANLAYALDTDKTKATVLLMETAVGNQQIFSYLLAKYVKKQLDSRRMEQLRTVVNYINQSDSNRHEDINIPALVRYLFHTIGETARRITDIVVEWMDGLEE